MNSSTAIGSAVIAALSAFGVMTVTGPPAQQEAVAWEYKVERGPGISITASAEEIAAGMAAAEGILNRLGQEGWELVDYESPYAIFRRPATAGRRRR